MNFHLTFLIVIMTITLMINGCSSQELIKIEDKQTLTRCNMGSFEADYGTVLDDRANAFDIANGVTYYGYCGWDS